MLSLDDVNAVLAEMAPVCVGGFIQKIQQPAPDTVILFLRRPGRSLAIALSAHSQYGRLHILSQKVPSVPTPPSFCQYARAHLLGAQIHRLAQTSGDRIVWFELIKGAQVFLLVVALTGRSANIFVLDAQTTVLRSLKPSRQAIGQPFNLAPCPWRGDSPAEAFPSMTDAEKMAFPVSERIEASYSTSELNATLEDERHRQIAHVRKHVKKLQRQIEKLTQDFAKVDAYREYGRYGELLKGHVSALGKGQKHITIVDYFDDRLPEITLPLNPEKDGPGNLKNYFTKYGKFTGARKNLVPRLNQAKTELTKYQQELEALEIGKLANPQETEQVAALQKRQAPLRAPQRSKQKNQPAVPYREFSSQEGCPILVGKTAKDNDAVTFKVSKPDDLWLHARGTPGSHVIVRLEKKQQVPPETLKDAATLALFYSDLRKSGKGEVIYTLRKNVRKPKGAKTGSVTVTQERNLWVFVDQARLDRLKESGPQSLEQALEETGAHERRRS
ncbi:MAG: NFACT family protein [Nitrospira sp.]|nr:NFACT family protein [Nitrospira sp.]